MIESNVNVKYISSEQINLNKIQCKCKIILFYEYHNILISNNIILKPTKYMVLIITITEGLLFNKVAFTKFLSDVQKKNYIHNALLFKIRSVYTKVYDFGFGM